METPVTSNDYIELSRLVTEIAWRIDHERADTVWELFIPSGTLNSNGNPLIGHEAIRSWGEDRIKSTTLTRHICSGMRFVKKSETEVSGTTLLTVFSTEKDTQGQPIPKVVGEDYDEFVRTPEGWKFSSRTFKTLFS